MKSKTLEERFKLIRSVGDECIQEDELWQLLRERGGGNPEIVCYDGFEPSGRMHIAQGIQKAISVNRLTSAGCTFKFWIADWFAQLNNKLDGDLEKIQTVGKYFIEIWKACGMDMSRVQFLWASEEINKRADEYWMRVMDIARANKLPRIVRCSQIMGRADTDDLTAAQILYPCMQCADIFFLKADICQLGMDQRKVNMLAREYCEKQFKPIILSHHLLPGLKQGQEKMSKSDPNSAVFMEDSEQEVNRKIKRAFCPPEQVQGNPCLEYVQYLVLERNGEFSVDRNEENGGPVIYRSVEHLHRDYESGRLHPSDLKPALAKSINSLLEPVRLHFEKDKGAKALLEKVRKYQEAR
ncbi:hypothetical protein GpartN1_g1922.t1 [Galdieria partita]|uniref:tyrosine--tRNA ligase n=1 Tax=Galdieria partita TaxID=83374 RepID=A0A9C7PTG3_9RHOD|nr:hypothetical protein GpartN1_g1922.t1 [Galdieria partita]